MFLIPPPPNKDCSFFEVKAVRGTLTPASSRYQMVGLIDGLARLPFRSRGGARRTLTLITTADAIITPDVVLEATASNVAM